MNVEIIIGDVRLEVEYSAYDGVVDEITAITMNGVSVYDLAFECNLIDKIESTLNDLIDGDYDYYHNGINPNC